MTREIVISVVSPRRCGTICCDQSRLLLAARGGRRCGRGRPAGRFVSGGGGCCHGLGDATLLLTAQFGLLSVKYGLKTVLQGNHSCLYAHMGI